MLLFDRIPKVHTGRTDWYMLLSAESFGTH